MSLRPKNEVAGRVLDWLPQHVTPVGGFFGGQDYCCGIAVNDVAEAFRLGAEMGAAAGVEFGEIGFDQVGTKLYVVFREATVSQAPDAVESRIPKLQDPVTPSNYADWCKAMAELDLIYHPDESPREIIYAHNSERVFTDQEADELSVIMDRVFAAFDGEKASIIYDELMRAAGVLDEIEADCDQDLDAGQKEASPSM